MVYKISILTCIWVLLNSSEMSKKVIIFFGTRPEAIKLAPVIKQLEKYSFLNILPVSTGQHSTMLEQALKVFNIRPYLNLNVMTQMQSLTNLTSNKS